MNSTNDQNQGLKGCPTVLVVDDEELMREVTALMIEDAGGKVITAVDGADAVDVYRQNQESVEVVLMDFSMPRMNGYEAYEAIRKISDTVKFIMISGLNITEEVRELREQGLVRFLAKPFGEDELLTAINEVVSHS